MNNLNWRMLFSGTGILVLSSFFAILLLIGILLYSFFSPDEKKPTDISPTPTSAGTSSKATPPPIDIENLPEATPQPFRNADEKRTGTLVVTSSVPDTIVLLDASGHPEPEDPIALGQPWPQNITPFIVKEMPVGNHVLEAIKPPLYDMKVETFTIRPGEITRVHIELIRLRTSN